MFIFAIIFLICGAYEWTSEEKAAEFEKVFDNF